MVPAIQMMRDYLEYYLGADEGQGMVEYSLIIGTISIVLIAGFMVSGINTAVGQLATNITNAITGHSSTALTP